MSKGSEAKKRRRRIRQARSANSASPISSPARFDGIVRQEALSEYGSDEQSPKVEQGDVAGCGDILSDPPGPVASNARPDPDSVARLRHDDCDHAPEARLDRCQAARELGLAQWQFDLSVQLELIYGPSDDGLWGQWDLEAIADEVAAIRVELGNEPPLGSERCAARIAARLNVDFLRDDFQQLVNQGALQPISSYKGSPTYSLKDVDAYCADHGPEIRETIRDRENWFADSLNETEALRILGWTWDELARVCRERGIVKGRAGRYGLDDIESLVVDDALHEQIVSERLMGPTEAAQALGIRRRDFDYCIAAGWISPARWTQTVIKGRTVDVALYRCVEVGDLLEVPDVDWAAVRATRPGKPSLLRRFATLPISRADTVRRFVADIAYRYGVAATVKYRWRDDEWHILWTPDEDGAPTPETLAAEWKASAAVAEITGSVVFDTCRIADRDRIRPEPSMQPSDIGVSNELHCAAWEQAQSKIVSRLRAFQAPGLTRSDARILASRLLGEGVQPVRLTDHEQWATFNGPWRTGVRPNGTAEHIAALCGRLLDSVEWAFAANLNRHEATLILEYLEPGSTDHREDDCVDL